MSLPSGLCLVTGATGFVGSAVARALVESGQKVRVLARPHSDRRNLERLPVEIAEGALEDFEIAAGAVAGCRYLFHVAADYRLWVPDPAAMFRVNVEGTRELMLAAQAAGVERIVYTSSVAVLGIVKGGIADEETPSRAADMIGPYKPSKFAGRGGGPRARRGARSAGGHRQSVDPDRPGRHQADADRPADRRRRRAAACRLLSIPGSMSRMSMTSRSATARGAGSGKIGRRYILGGENMAWPRSWPRSPRSTGRRPPLLRFPHGAVLPIAAGAEAGARLTRREPFATVDGVRMSLKKMFFSSARAIGELGYAPRPGRYAIADAVAWFRANGYMR